MGNLTHTVSGDIASFRSAARVPIESLKCHFLPVQEGSGDPSPENVRPISGWNNIKTYCHGKNLIKLTEYTGQFFNVANETDLKNITERITVVENNNVISLSVSDYPWYGCVCATEMLQPGNYTIHTELSDSNVRRSVYITDANFITVSRSSYVNDNLTITLVERGRIIVTLSLQGAGTTGTITNLQVEIGNNYTSYEPYRGEIIPITFPNVSKNLFEVTPLSYDDWTGEGYYNSYLDRMNPTIDTTNKTISITCQGSGDSIIYKKTHYAPGTYTLSYDMTYSGNINTVYKRMVIMCFKDDGTMMTEEDISIPGLTWNKYYKGFFAAAGTFTVPKTVDYFTICFGISNDTKGETATFSNIQLEVGSTATTYEPYSFRNTLYGGYVDIATGEVWQTIKYHTFNGEEQITDYSSGITGGKRFVSIVFDDCQSDVKYMYCDKAVVETSVQYQISHLGIRIGGGQGRFYFFVPDSMFDGEVTIDKFKQWLSENNLTATALLITPKLVGKLTPMELKTFLNYNNIWSNTNDITEVTYQIHDSNMIQQAKKNIMAENETHYRKVLWNNIADGNISDTDWKIYNTNNVTATFNDGIASCEVIDTTKIRYSAGIVMKTYPPVTQNNIYYASYMIKPEYQGSFGIEYAAGQQLDGTEIQCPANTWTRRSFITNGRIDANGAMCIPFPAGYPSGITPKFQIKSPIYINLTAMFGMDNEPTLAEFEHLCEINNINLTQAYTKNTGTEQIWCIPDHNTNEYTTVEWNQNAKPINSSNYTAYNSEHIAVTFEDDVLVSTWLTSGSSYSWSSCANYSKRHTVGNYYYLQYEYYTDIDGYIGGGVGGTWTQCVKTQINQWTKYSTITQRLSSGNLDNYAAYVNFFSNTIVPQANNICKARNIIAIDLTTMFGAGNEPLTVEELYARCLKNNINLNEAQPYNTGTKMIWKV